MAANLFGERYLGRQVAWHQLGETFDEPLTMTEAVKRCGLDYEVHLAPLYAHHRVRGVDLFGAEIQRAKTHRIQVPNRYAIMRSPTQDDLEPRIFGTVSSTYEVIQNTEIAQAMDELVEEWPVETCGALGKGETTFFTLSVGNTDIRGDQIEEFFLISDKKTGKSALKIAFVPVRVVCQNTLTAALGSAKVLSFLSHREGVGGRLDSRVQALKKLQSIRAKTLQNFHRLAEAVLEEEQIDTIFEAAYPTPTKPKKVRLLEEHDDEEDLALLGNLFAKAQEAKDRWLYYKDRAIGMREDAKEELVRINDEELAELPHLQNTAWAAWQAITAKEDHRDGPESLYESALFGARAKTKVKAFNQAMEFVK